jgi:hypothetical protein
VLLVFAEGDDGLEFFTNRVARALRHVQRSGVVEVVEVAGIDHSMHRHWMRGDMVAVLTGFLSRLPSAQRQDLSVESRRTSLLENSTGSSTPSDRRRSR